MKLLMSVAPDWLGSDVEDAIEGIAEAAVKVAAEITGGCWGKDAVPVP